MLDFDFRIVLQIIGALLCIANYLLVQTHRLRATQPASLLLVISSCAVLLTSATIGHDWGLILLEGTWLVMVSATLIMRQRAAGAAAAGEALVEPLAEPVIDAEAITEPIVIPESILVPRTMDPALDPYSTGELQLAGAAR